MDKIPFTFPVFYNGLIEKRILKNQQSAMNILFNGTDNDLQSYMIIDRTKANKYISGAEAIPRLRCDELLALSLDKVISRINVLGIQNAKTMVSAFHSFLRSKTDITTEEMNLLESIITQTADPYRYIAKALLLSLSHVGDTRHIDTGTRNVLKTLHITDEITDLFSGMPVPSADNIPAPHADTTLSAFVDTAIPMIVRRILATLFVEKNTDQETIEYLKTTEFDRAVKNFLDSGKMSLYEFYKCNNFIEIAQKADKELQNVLFDGNRGDKKHNTQSEFDFDWFLRFFEAAGNITNEDMQYLWAKVLAGEIQSPGSFSLRTVETLRNMTANEALTFKNACAIVLTELDGTRFIFYDDALQDFHLNERHGVETNDLFILEECGLISAMRIENLLEFDDSEICGFLNDRNIILQFSRLKDSSSFSYRSYPLTQTAIQLFRIIHDPNDTDEDYIFDLGRTIKNEYNDIKISAHQVLSFSNGEMNLNKVNLL